MIPKKSNFKTRQLVACALLAGFAAAGALAATTDVSNVPLATGTPLPPNVLFTLDNSGSMDWDFLPDNVDPNISNGTSPSNPCMTEAGGSTSAKCTRGDPPHEAGGQNGSNGVSYDPTLRYLPGITSTGALKLNPGATPPGSFSPFTSVPNDAYGATSGSANLVTGANVIGSIDNGTPVSAAFDKAYCNASNATVNASKACKRPGVDIGGTVLTPSGTLDPEGNSMGAGQFPYRANVSSGSNKAFGMPEMMTTASFARSGSTVTATTAGKPGLSVGDKVWVSASNTAVNATCVAVATVTATTFTYASSNGTVAANNGSYRRCGTGTWTRVASSSTINVTITSAGDALQNNDVIIVDSSDNNQDKISSTATVAGIPVGTTFSTTFTYTGTNTGSTASSGTLTWVRTGLYNFSTPLTASPALVATVPPVAYTITPIEYCSDINLTTCQEVIPPAAPPAGSFPAYVRFCKTQADAIAMGAVTGTSGAPATARCQAKYTNPNAPLYQFPRYGRFNRESIVNDGRTFANRPNRTDCTAVGTPGTCNWTEEMQNIANWYTYYRTRMQMMKTATGRAFQQFVSNPAGSPPRPDTLRVGYITINSPTSSNNYLKINNFNATQASSWYTSLYAANPGSGTPLKTALSRAGWIFAGKMNTGLTSGIPAADDPIQASCQRNYSILTTDGFWNASAAAGQTLGATSIGNVDNVQSAAGVDQLVSQSDGTWDGGVAGASGTLADVAQYYYQTDLRNAGAGPLTSPNSVPTANQDVSTNNVPAKSGNKDFLTTQHMVTYTLGMADGLMRYQSDYETANSGDFFNIKNGTVGACFWMPANTACAWPAPVGDTPSALDDLWHAAVNGRGTFYQALNAAALATSLSNALGNLNAQTAAAAASATSSPNITQTDNQIFSTTYQTNTWSGKIFAQTIDPVTGNVNPSILWQADTQMALKTGPATDSRLIKTPNPNLGGLMDFTFANILANSPAAANFFQNKCTGGALSQCGAMPAGDKPVADSGINLVNFLRGQSINESSPSCTRNLAGTPPTACVFRDRQEVDPISNAVTQTVIGDTISAKPVFVRGALFDYGGTYDAFKASMSTRAPRLYVGANDGYLHAFNGNTGDEVWAYAPRFLLPALYQLADTAYSANHRFFVDGSPETGDVQDGSGNWKTIIVGGAAGGGRGWYALDITDPNNPQFLWEFCADASLCTKNDADVGFSFGNPVIGKRPDGKWVVVLSSGLNNVPPPAPTTLGGTGGGYFYVLDAITGQVLTKSPTLLSGTNPGTTTTPSGLMKISAYFNNPVKDATFDFVYGGDQLGNVWRMDMPLDSSTPNVLHLATLQDTAGRKQPITTRMALTHINSNRVFYVGTGRYLGSSDLSDPGVASGIAWQQSIYAIKDKVVDATGDYGNIRNANLVQQSLINASATTRTTSNVAVDWNSRDGWFIDLNPGNTTPGERVNVDPELIIGTLVIASNIPTTSAACTVGGDSFLYQFDFKTGQYIANALNNVAGTLLGGITVGMAVVQLPSGAIKDIVTTADTSKTSQGVNVGAATAYLRRFSYRER